MIKLTLNIEAKDTTWEEGTQVFELDKDFTQDQFFKAQAIEKLNQAKILQRRWEIDGDDDALAYLSVTIIENYTGLKDIILQEQIEDYLNCLLD